DQETHRLTSSLPSLFSRDPKGSEGAASCSGSQQPKNQTQDHGDNAGPFNQPGENVHGALDGPGLFGLAGNTAECRVPDQTDADANADNGQSHADAGTYGVGREQRAGRRKNDEHGNRKQAGKSHHRQSPKRLGSL